MPAGISSSLVKLAVAIIFAAMCMSTAHADGPSFDCKKASSPDERAICGNKELSDLDLIIANGYRRMVDKVGKDQANAVNNKFFQARKACGANAACINANGQAEIPEIHAIDDSFPTQDQQYTLNYIAYDFLKKPIKIGDCVKSQIAELGPRLCKADILGNCPENLPFDDTGNSINASNHIPGVSYERDRGLEASKIGDPVQICLTRVPKHCPKGDDRGYFWRWKNLRTGKSWEFSDSEHDCGGA